MRSTNLTLAHSSISLVWQAAKSGMKNRSGPPAAEGRGAPCEAIDQDRPLADRFQRNAGVKVVARGVQRQVPRRRLGADPIEQPRQRHRVALALRVDAAYVAHLARRVERRQFGERQRPAAVRLRRRSERVADCHESTRASDRMRSAFHGIRRNDWMSMRRLDVTQQKTGAAPNRRTAPVGRLAGCSRASGPTILYEQPMLLPQLWQR